MTSDSNIAILLIFVGILGICLEFCRPGWVVPGVGGGIIGIVGIASLVHSVRDGHAGQISWTWVAAMLIPFAALSFWLAKVAVRAKRNKTSRSLGVSQ